ncbi:MAG: hypothetical protein OS112_04725 [Methanoregula sp.]|nr:MAG: hypothetical protein OS112_04725 [Methanoregula sp.]
MRYISTEGFRQEMETHHDIPEQNEIKKVLRDRLGATRRKLEG